MVNPASQPGSSRKLTSTSCTQVSAHRKQAGREKARLRSMRQEEKVLRRREKEGYTTPSHSSSPTSSRRHPRDPIEEDIESNIREYMARTGPRGERLTLAQQERLLKQELKGLGHQLETLEKKAKADEATRDLPELDDHTLEELYQALMLPPPPTKEEARLARLEDARRVKSLQSAGGRGRRGLERLPMSVVEEKKERTTRDLKQRLLDAREKGRVLLPPSTSTSSVKKEALGLREGVDGEGEVEEEVREELDMAALPYEEQQEIRLQHLFARLALVHSTPEPPLAAESGSESLQEIKSSLATRIAKILKEHEYELPSSVQKLPRDDDPQPAASDAATAELPPFKDVRLDGTASSLPTGSAQDLDADAGTDSGQVTAPRSTNEIDLVEKAESMINNLTSHESRTFMLDGIERLVRSATSSSTSNTDPQPARLPLGVASIDEWTALCVSSARASDTTTLSRTLHLMHLAGYHPPPLSLYNAILDSFANQGDVASCQHYLAILTSQGLTPDDHTHHTLVKAYVSSYQYLPAIQLLNSLENAGQPASMATYTLVISRLLSPLPLSPSSSVGGRGRGEEKPELQALAWNVFYHMRLNAHPVPDAPLYALMIRACARGIPQPTEIDAPPPTTTTSSGAGKVRISDAERALDLFREMTTRYHIRPNAEVYNSLILACARRKDFYLEAFRLLREMVELELSNPSPSPSSQDMGGEGGEGVRVMRFAPDRYTFNALLQGCARNRDLARARWVLAEMIRTTLPLFDEEMRKGLKREEVVELVAKRPGEETMCHVMHCYAAYFPPVKRDSMQITPPSNASTSRETPQKKQVDQRNADQPSIPTPNVEVTTQNPTSQLQKTQNPSNEEETTSEEAAQIFSALVPQTSSDLISEARSLFARVLADQPHSPSPTSKMVEGPLGAVTPTTRLINSYLTVLASHLAPTHRVRVLHSTLLPISSESEEEGGGLEFGLFRKLGCKPNEHSYRIMMEACADAAKESEVKMVEDIWSCFRSFLSSKSTSFGGREIVSHNPDETEGKVDGIQVKKSWSSYIHFYSKHQSLPPPPHANGKDGLDYAIEVLREFYSLYPPQLAQIGEGKSKKASKRAQNNLKTQLRPNGTLASLDLSPLPIPLKSLQSLQTLPLPPQQEGEEGLEWMSNRPTLTFLDVQLLHHRLVRFGKVKDLAYCSWLLHRYSTFNRT